jgi:hypothetical protein
MLNLPKIPFPRRVAASFNNRVERTAAMRLDFDGDGLQTVVVAVVSTLPAAVAHPCRRQHLHALAISTPIRK